MKLALSSAILLLSVAYSLGAYYYGGGYNMYGGGGGSRAVYIPYPVPMAAQAPVAATAAPALPLGGFGLGYGLGDASDDGGLFGGGGTGLICKFFLNFVFYFVFLIRGRSIHLLKNIVRLHLP